MQSQRNKNQYEPQNLPNSCGFRRGWHPQAEKMAGSGACVVPASRAPSRTAHENLAPIEVMN